MLGSDSTGYLPVVHISMALSLSIPCPRPACRLSVSVTFSAVFGRFRCFRRFPIFFRFSSFPSGSFLFCIFRRNIRSYSRFFCVCSRSFPFFFSGFFGFAVFVTSLDGFVTVSSVFVVVSPVSVDWPRRCGNGFTGTGSRAACRCTRCATRTCWRTPRNASGISSPLFM